MSGAAAAAEETKIIYHIDDEGTPYLIKLNLPPEKVTLIDFKNALNKPNYKFFFKSMDDDFGVVKEEITDDTAPLPCINGRIVSWLVSAEGSAISDNLSQNAVDSQPDQPGERVAGTGDSRPPSFHGPGQQPACAGAAGQSSSEQEGGVADSDTLCDTCTDTDSVYSAMQDRVPPLRSFHDYKHGGRINGHRGYQGGYAGAAPPVYETTSSMMSSDLESTSFFDSEDESRLSSATGTTMSSAIYGRERQQKRRRRLPPISRASSFSSITDSTMSLNIMTVTLNMETVNFLGISIVGQSNKGGDGGIYVGSIMKGGAVAMDARIEPGDMILEVNGISFDNMSNDDAVRTLREQVQKPGPITLVVAKSWDPNPKGYFTIPRQEPVRPIDPRAWVLHTNAMTAGEGQWTGLQAAPSMGTVASESTMTGFSLPAGTSAAAFAAQQQRLQQQQQMMQQKPPPPPPSYHLQGTASVVTSSSSLPESDRYPDEVSLTVNTDVGSVVRAMAQPDSGLEIRDRLWLKITLPRAFIGSDLVDWLWRNVEGFADRRDARKYAANLLRFGYIRHTVNKVTFSEQCYYIFGDLAHTVSRLSLEEVDSVSEADPRDRLAPLPPPHWTTNQAPGHPQRPSGVGCSASNMSGYSQAGGVPLTSSGPLPPNYALSLGAPPSDPTGVSSQYSSVPPFYHTNPPPGDNNSDSGSSSGSSVSQRSVDKAMPDKGPSLPPPPPPPPTSNGSGPGSGPLPVGEQQSFQMAMGSTAM